MSFIVYMELKYCCPALRVLPGTARRFPALPGELRGFLARRSGATVEGSNNPTPSPRVKGKRVGCQLSQSDGS